MATNPPANLPILYKNLQPLSTNLHGKYRNRISDKAPHLANVHAVPLTVDEFVDGQRFFPIVFSTGENAVPLALMGLNEGVNVFVDEEGKALNPFYVPAYIRRYPYLLARLDPNAQELSLCFDPDSGLVGEFEDGTPLFEDDKPTDTLNAILKFCEDFEIAGQRTQAFIKELEALDLLIDGELSIQPADAPQPFVYRGFRMVAEEKFRDLNGDQLRKMNQNGVLALVLAHLFSLSLSREIFSRQLLQGKMPQQAPAMAGADA